MSHVAIAPRRDLGHDWPMRRMELLTTDQMTTADRLTIASGTPGIDLMEAAGRAVADVAAVRAAGRPVAVLCGPGNNGGDGFVAARLLRERGHCVEIGLLGDLASLRGDAALAANRWNAPVLPVGDVDLSPAGCLVDALFGAGLARDLDGVARSTVERINEWQESTGRPVIAVDVPSGLDGNNGQIRGAAIKATATVTFFRFKPGHFLMPGPDLCGELRLADIGIADAVLAQIMPAAFLNDPALWASRFPIPGRQDHKYTRGHVVVCSGGPWSTGASRLSATGALRAGAGLVTMAVPRAVRTIQASHLTAVMMTPCDDAGDLHAILGDPRKTVVVMGPGLGLGEATKALVRAALKPRTGARGVILDADALTSFAAAGKELKSLIADAGTDVILTPHEGEFSRIFNKMGFIPESRSEIRGLDETVFHNRLETARAAAASIGATLVLKGSDTVVAHRDGRASIVANLPPWLATAGSGDVLAGILGGILAQGMPAFEAASAAVWLHGEAARHFGAGLISEDLPTAIPAVLQEWTASGALTSQPRNSS